MYIPDIQIETNGVVEFLQSLEAHKAAGPDEIPAHLLSVVLAPLLSLIFQASLHQCTLPSEWKRAYVVSIFKKGK